MTQEPQNNPMSADLTKPDVAGTVERVTRFTDKSALSIIDQISAIATGEETVGSLVEDIRTILADHARLNDIVTDSYVIGIVQANEDLGAKCAEQHAEIERLREGVYEVIDAADPVVAAIKKIHPNDQGLDVMRLVNAISHLKALKGGAE